MASQSWRHLCFTASKERSVLQSWAYRMPLRTAELTGDEESELTVSEFPPEGSPSFNPERGLYLFASVDPEYRLKRPARVRLVVCKKGEVSTNP